MKRMSVVFIFQNYSLFSQTAGHALLFSDYIQQNMLIFGDVSSQTEVRDIGTHFIQFVYED